MEADLISGDAGDDKINGDKGNDTLTGGSDNDLFVIDDPGNKTILDFNQRRRRDR